MKNQKNTTEETIPNIDIYPNPVRKILNFSFREELYRPQQIEFYDMGGNKIHENKYASQHSPLLHINLGDFNPGTYIVKIKTSEGDLYRKVVKK